MRYNLNGGESGQWQKLLVTDPPAPVPPPTRYCLGVCVPDVIDDALGLVEMIDLPSYWFIEPEGC